MRIINNGRKYIDNNAPFSRYQPAYLFYFHTGFEEIEGMDISSLIMLVFI